MKYIDRTPAVLLLQDGAIFHGNSAGKIGTSTGEICFNTGMTGYQEIFTDPSYYGQIMVANNVHVGNYGILSDESESDSIKISALVCRNFSQHYSRKMANMNIHDFFVEKNIVVIRDVDTRALVRYIRDKGAMNAIISSETTDIEVLQKQLQEVPSMEGLELASKVSTTKSYYFGNSDSTFKVAVLDLGVKKNSLRNLASRDCYVKVFPWDSTAEEILAWEPHGLLISNGPGDPAVMKSVVETIKHLLAIDLPLFGICLGHQILAQACGISTYKMFNGHRGINHPVKNMITGLCEVTSQNHGFAISRKDVMNSGLLEITHINLNDDSVEGIRVKDKNAFSVQYHPEAAPGPNDASYLFDDFLKNIEISLKIRIKV